MPRLHLIVLVVFLFSNSLLASPETRRSKEDPGRPNIILAMADDQGWGDMAYNGHPFLKTPVFDEMARTALHGTYRLAATVQVGSCLNRWFDKL